MKRTLIMLIMGAFAGCSNNAQRTEHAVDSSANAIIDSLQIKTDSLSNVIDSTNKKAIDTGVGEDSGKKQYTSIFYMASNR